MTASALRPRALSGALVFRVRDAPQRRDPSGGLPHQTSQVRLRSLQTLDLHLPFPGGLPCSGVPEDHIIKGQLKSASDRPLSLTGPPQILHLRRRPQRVRVQLRQALPQKVRRKCIR